MNILKEIFTKLISFLSRVHLGRVMKGKLAANNSARGRSRLKVFSKTTTSNGQKTKEKGVSYDSTRR